MNIKQVKFKDSYLLVPFCYFPFSGDYILIDDKTGTVLHDSRIDGYDPLYCDYLITWSWLEKDESVPEGAIYKFSIINPEEV